jgi:hypothetical protein
MTDLRKAAEQAAKELKELIHWHGIRYSNDKLMPAHKQTPEIKSAMKTLKELRQALAEPANSTTGFVEPKALSQTEQEPVAWMYEWDGRINFTTTDQRFVEAAHPHFVKSTPLYTAPPKREWVGIEPQEIGQIWANHKEVYGFGIELERVLKERNT